MAKAKRVQSWGDVPNEKIREFHDAVMKLRDEMIPRDCDGDSPVGIIIYNKKTHTCPAYPVPHNEVYDYEKHRYKELPLEEQIKMDLETEKWLANNIHSFATLLDKHINLKTLRLEEELAKKKG